MKKKSVITSLLMFVAVMMLSGCLFPVVDDERDGHRRGGHHDRGYHDGGHRDGDHRDGEKRY